MNSNEVISSMILSNVDIIAEIFGIIKTSAIEAVDDPIVKGAQSNVCVIKPNSSGVNRVTTECKFTDKYSIEFDPNDIMILGGAALNIYDYKLKDFKARRGLYELENYIKKKTSDIDIVWWPHPSTSEEIITSRSEAIIQLVTVFVTKLNKNFEKNQDKLMEKIRPYINGLSNTDKLQIKVSDRHTFQAGVFNINIVFKVKDKVLKICDVIVHDSGASQRFDPDGKEITDLRFMTEDPVYCTPIDGLPNSISYLKVNETTIPVPNILAFVKQQMFAFNNLVKAKQTKSLINYKRVSFVKKLLESFVLNNNGNKANYMELKDVFGKEQSEYVDNILYEVNDTIYESINKLNYSILEICSTVNKSKDDIVLELCDLADRASHGELIREEKVSKNDINRKNIIPPIRPIGPPRDASTPIGKMEARIREINRALKHTLNRANRLKLLEEKKLLTAKVEELVAVEENRFAETYKEMVVTKIQRAIENIKGYEKERGLSDNLKRKIQMWKSNFIRDITLLRKNSANVVYSKKAHLDDLLNQIHDIDKSIVSEIRAEKNMGNVSQMAPVTMLQPGMIDITTHSIWTGKRWIRPQEIDPETRSLWSGSQWFLPNYVDSHSGAIWTGIRWIKPHEYNPDNNLIWSGREWLPVPGTIDPASGAFWNGNIWIKKGQVNPQTGLYWDGYIWKEFNKFTGEWQPIRQNRSVGILQRPGYIRKGGDKTIKNTGKYKNNNFTRRR